MVVFVMTGLLDNWMKSNHSTIEIKMNILVNIRPYFTNLLRES
jgi:hypothetical protein